MKSESLFSLIDGMSPAEKRHFKLYIQRNNKKSASSLYLKVFNELEKMSQLKRRTPNINYFFEPNVRKQLPVIKRYLGDIVLDSLRVFYKSNEPSFYISNQIQNSHLLFLKGLPEESLKILHRLKKDVADSQLYFFIPVIYEMQKKILMCKELYTSEDLKLIDQILSDDTLRSSIYDSHKISNDYLRFLTLTKGKIGILREGSDREKLIRSFTYDKKLKNDQSDSNFIQAQTNAAYIKIIRGDVNRAIASLEDIVHYFEHNMKFALSHSHLYVNAINNLSLQYYRIKDYQKFEQCNHKTLLMIEKLRSHLSVQYADRVSIQVKSNFLSHIISTGEFKTGLSFIKNHKLILVDDSGFLTEQLKLDFNIATVYYGSGDLKMAAKLYGKINAKYRLSIRPDVQAASRMMLAIIAYDNRNIDELDVSLRNWKYYFESRLLKYPAEDLIYKFLSKKIESKLPELKLLLDKIQLLEAEDKGFLNYFNFKAWVFSKIKKRSFSDAVKHVRSNMNDNN